MVQFTHQVGELYKLKFGAPPTRRRLVGLVSYPVISHVIIYHYKLYNASLPLVYLVESIARNSLIKI